MGAVLLTTMSAFMLLSAKSAKSPAALEAPEISGEWGPFSQAKDVLSKH